MTTRTVRILTIAAAASLAAACADRISASPDGSTLLDAAFTSTPLGFSSTANSFGSVTSSTGGIFVPEHGHGGPHGRNGLREGFDFMGGGLGLDFLGGIGGGHRPFDNDGDDAAASCTTASSGAITCTETLGGLSVTRTETYTTTAGTVQTARDTATNSVTSHIVVTGSRTRRDSSTTTVNNVSDRTVTGLASASTQRTVNGTSAGTESTAGRDSVGSFTSERIIGDTVSGIIVPVASGRPTYPTAGTVIRSMKVTVTYAGQAATSSTRREVITYNGSATAAVAITQDGTTKSCTLPLPHGRPVCP
jgi:hypothetical protein